MTRPPAVKHCILIRLNQKNCQTLICACALGSTGTTATVINTINLALVTSLESIFLIRKNYAHAHARVRGVGCVYVCNDDNNFGKMVV